jgi:hypothetical protein
MSKPIAVMDFGWGNKLAMPLDVAHKVQTLLLTAVKLEEEYRVEAQRFATITAYTPPGVTIQDSKFKLFDATSLTNTEFVAWKETVKSSLDSDVLSTADDIVPPDAWKAMKGGAA